MLEVPLRWESLYRKFEVSLVTADTRDWRSVLYRQGNVPRLFSAGGVTGDGDDDDDDERHERRRAVWRISLSDCI